MKDFNRRQFVKQAYTGMGDITDMLGQNVQALSYYARGIAFCDDPADRSNIMQSIAQIYVDRSRFADASAMVRKARRALEPIRNRNRMAFRRGMAGIHNVQSWIYRLKGDINSALREAKAGLRVLPLKIRDHETLEQKTKILNTLGGAYYQIGDHRCLSYYYRALRIEKRLGHNRNVATLNNNLGNAYAGFGNYVKGITLTKDFLQISERVGDREGIATAAESLGCQYYILDDHRRAIEYLLRSYGISVETGSDYGVSYTSNNLGIVYLGIGETKKALHYFRQDLRLARRNGIKRNEARAFYNIGLVYLRSREYEKARQALEPAVRLLEQIKDRVRLQNAMHRLAVAVGSQKRGRKRALRLLKRSLRMARMTPPRSEVAAVHVNYGKVMGFIRDAVKVKFHFDKALAIYRQDGLRRQEADACVDYAQTLMSVSRNTGAAGDMIKRLLLRARAIYKKLDIEIKLKDADRLIEEQELISI